MQPYMIHSVDIPDAWFQCVYNILKYGKKYKIDRGSYEKVHYRIEFDYITIRIKFPYNEDINKMIPKIPEHYNIPDPVDVEYINDYIPYLMTDEKKENESYTYGERIAKQIPYWIDVLKKHKNTNQAILQVGAPNDYVLSDPACLRHIDLNLKEDKLNFFIYFRSWDLWNGFPSNLIGLAILQNYMASEIGVKEGEFICASKGLHIYDYVEKLAKIRTNKM